MQIAINNVANTELLLAGSGSLPLSYKPNAKGEIRTGSFAKAMMYATGAARKDAGAAMYAKWLANGQYRPLIRDAMEEVVPKAARPFVSAIVPPIGPVTKEAFVQFCIACTNAIDDSGREPKGKKADYYRILKAVVDSARADAGEGDVVAEQ